MDIRIPLTTFIEGALYPFLKKMKYFKHTQYMYVLHLLKTNYFKIGFVEILGNIVDIQHYLDFGDYYLDLLIFDPVVGV